MINEQTLIVSRGRLYCLHCDSYNFSCFLVARRLVTILFFLFLIVLPRLSDLFKIKITDFALSTNRRNGCTVSIEVAKFVVGFRKYLMESQTYGDGAWNTKTISKLVDNTWGRLSIRVQSLINDDYWWFKMKLTVPWSDRVILPTKKTRSSFQDIYSSSEEESMMEELRSLSTSPIGE